MHLQLAGAPKTWTSGTAEGPDLSCVLAVHDARHDVALDSPFKKALKSIQFQPLPAFTLNIIEQHIELYMPLQILYRLGVAV